MMDVYLLILYVSREQEHAIKQLFSEKSWLFCKSETARHMSPKRTVVQFDSLDSCTARFHTVSDWQADQLTPLHGNLTETESAHSHPTKQERQSSSMNLTGSEGGAGFQRCFVQLEQIPKIVNEHKEKELNRRIKRKVKGKPKYVNSRRKRTLPIAVEKVNAMMDSNIELNNSLELKTENDNTGNVGFSSGTEHVMIEYVDNLPIDISNYSCGTAHCVSDNDADNMSSEAEEVDESVSDQDNQLKTDPDYQYGAHTKKKRCPIKKRNLDENSEKGSFSCKICKRTYRFNRNYMNHLEDGVCNGRKKVRKNGKRDEKTGTGIYKCSVCDKTYTYKRKYLSHFVDDRCIRQCKYCDRVYKKMCMKKHVFYKHELEDERLRCKICNKRMFEQSDLNTHIMHFHNTSKTFVCDFCGKSFFAYYNFYFHQRKHKLKLSGMKAHCNLCNKDFNDVSYLEYHRKVTHLTVRDCMCEICGKKFKTPRCVKSHMRTHSDDRPFQCDVCRKFYKYSHQLSSHKKMFHSKLKRFFCKMCNKGFYFEGKLKDHLNIHTGDRPHHCQACDYSAHTRNQLTQHKRKHRYPKIEPVHQGIIDIMTKK